MFFKNAFAWMSCVQNHAHNMQCVPLLLPASTGDETCVGRMASVNPVNVQVLGSAWRPQPNQDGQPLQTNLRTQRKSILSWTIRAKLLAAKGKHLSKRTTTPTQTHAARAGFKPPAKPPFKPNLKPFRVSDGGV